jgi:hypothetical protein
MSQFDASTNSYRLSSDGFVNRLQPSAIALPNILELAMNNISRVAAVTAASLAFTGAAQAASNKMLDQMMDTCIQQFVASNLVGYEGKVTIRKSNTIDNGPSLVAGSSSYRITVSAVSRPGGAQLATATCEMAHDGSVISIRSVPLAALKNLPRAESTVVAKN